MGSKGVSPSMVMMVKLMGSCQFAIVGADFVLGNLNSYIYDRMKVGIEWAKGCDKQKLAKRRFDLHVFFLIFSFFLDRCMCFFS